MQSLMILGRQPALGLAELESLYGADKLQPVGEQAVIVDVDPCLLAFDRLGGSVKFCKVLTTLDTTNWQQIEKFLVEVSPGHSQQMPDGKMQLGLSLYGFKESVSRIEATGLTLKKAIRTTGRSVRLIPNKEAALNSATVHHNHLTGPLGWELIFVSDGVRTVVAQTIKVQDIVAYAQRDYGRPKRDARVGMLPPKLAQIIINLATGKLPDDKLESICEIPAGEIIPRPHLGQIILDPFCGTGVILQEAVLMGYDVHGTDLEPRLVEYTKLNLAWLNANYHLEGSYQFNFVPLDATVGSWQVPVDFVASETYLGRPFTAPPSPEILAQTVADCNLIIKRFLKNIHGQLQPGTRLCLAIPAWRLTKNNEQRTMNSAAAVRHSREGGNPVQKGVAVGHSSSPGSPIRSGMTQWRCLPLIDQITEIGYNRVSFEHAESDQLLYYREGQFTARELLVLTRL